MSEPASEIPPGTGPGGPRPPAIVARGLTLGYGSSPAAVTDVSCAIPSGSITVFIGPNGSGKSTLLGAIAGLVEPRAGSLEVLGLLPRRAHRQVALVLQSADVNERMPVTVREAVAMGRYVHHGLVGRLGRDDRRIIEANLERLAIADLANRHLHELSGGQRQRVFVAQGLVQEAPVLLLDEPVTGLDVPSRERIVEVIAAERDRGHTVVVSTHDLAEASTADHVLLLAGRVVASGPPDQVLTSSSLSEAYGTRLVRLDGGTVLLDDAAHGHTSH